MVEQCAQIKQPFLYAGNRSQAGRDGPEFQDRGQRGCFVNSGDRKEKFFHSLPHACQFFGTPAEVLAGVAPEFDSPATVPCTCAGVIECDSCSVVGDQQPATAA